MSCHTGSYPRGSGEQVVSPYWCAATPRCTVVRNTATPFPDRCWWYCKHLWALWQEIPGHNHMLPIILNRIQTPTSSNHCQSHCCHTVPLLPVSLRPRWCRSILAPASNICLPCSWPQTMPYHLHGNSHPGTSHPCSVNPICRPLPVILNYNCYVCICTWIYIGHESLLGLSEDFLMPRYLESNLHYIKPALDINVRSSGHSHDLSKLLTHLLSRLIYLCCAGCICTHVCITYMSPWQVLRHRRRRGLSRRQAHGFCGGYGVVATVVYPPRGKCLLIICQ